MNKYRKRIRRQIFRDIEGMYDCIFVRNEKNKEPAEQEWIMKLWLDSLFYNYKNSKVIMNEEIFRTAIGCLERQNFKVSMIGQWMKYYELFDYNFVLQYKDLFTKLVKDNAYTVICTQLVIFQRNFKKIEEILKIKQSQFK